MALIKRNIWSLFYLIVLVLSIFFVLISYGHWNHINKEYRIQNESFSKIIAQSTENYFRQIDVLLEVLEQQLQYNDNYKNKSIVKELFQDIKSINETITGIALIDLNGNYIITTSDKPVSALPDLLSREETKHSFLEAKNSKKSVIGRTYKLKISKKLVIPIRKSFYDKHGNLIAVISIAIDAYNSKLFDKKNLDSHSKIINLVRSKDRYRQLYVYIDEHTEDEKLYSQPIPKKSYEGILSQLEKDYNMPLTEIMDTQVPVSFKYVNSANNKIYLISLKYIKKYDLWASSYTHFKEIESDFLFLFTIYTLIFVITVYVIWSFFRYISKVEEHKRELLEYRAMHDTLTALPNHFYLKEKFEDWKNSLSTYAVIFMDIDNFKSINDYHGHELGDALLVKIIRRLQKNLQLDDLIIRHNGDEFIILTKETNQLDTYCQMIVDSFHQQFEIEYKYFNITCSLGVAYAPEHSEELSALITKADIACYKAKENKNRYVIFNEELQDARVEKLLIEEELKTAIEKEEFFLVYQPQVRNDHTLYGAETLVRWENEKLGVIGPDKFIPVVEESGMMPKLGDYILDKAFKEVKKSDLIDSIDFQLSINISVRQFMEEEFYEKLMSKINHYNISAKNITLEVTESSFVENLEYLKNLLQKLRDVGFTISMDDFGTGYSSLSMLRKIPINELKIDKAFIDEITQNSSAQHMAETILSISKILNYDVVIAEGIEDKEQAQLLNQIGCKTYQGYYFSKPLRINELESYIEEHHIK